MENQSTRIGVALHPDELKIVEKIRKALASKMGVYVPTTQIVRMGIVALAKQEGVK